MKNVNWAKVGADLIVVLLILLVASGVGFWFNVFFGRLT